MEALEQTEACTCSHVGMLWAMTLQLSIVFLFIVSLWVETSIDRANVLHLSLEFRTR